MITMKFFARRGYSLFLVFAVALGSGGCKPSKKQAESAISQINTSPSKRVNVIMNESPPPPDPFDKTRVRIAQNWVEAGIAVAVKARYQKAYDAVAFVRDNGIVSRPVANGFYTIAFSQGITEKHFRIVPVVEHDSDNPLVRQYMPRGVGGRLSRGIRILWLREKSMSQLFRGLTMIHESEHARQMDSSKYENGEAGWCMAEYDAFGLEISVLRMYGGDGYDKLTEDLSKKMVAQYRRSKKGAIDFPEYDNRFDTVLGKPTANEIGSRRTIIGLDVLHRSLEALLKGDARTKRAAIVRNFCTMYKTLGSTPLTSE